MSNIQPHEKVLEGKWLFDGQKMIADSTTQRISFLTHHYLERISVSTDGWRTLFKDETDGRYWVLEYPQAATQGAGAPRLTAVSPSAVRGQFKLKK